MRRHILLIVLTALLCASAGCLAVSAPVSDSEAPTATDIDSSYTITEETVTDTSTLIGAHTQVLQQHSYTVNVTLVGNGDSYRLVGNRTWQFNPSTPVRGMLHEQVSASGDPPDRFQQGVELTAYRDGETTYVRVLEGEERTFRRQDLLNSSVKANIATQRQLLASIQTLDNATVETVTGDGTKFYRVEQSLPDTEFATNRSVELLVSENGVIRELEFHAVRSGPDGEIEITRHVEFTNIGETSIERPDWYDEAVGETEN